MRAFFNPSDQGHRSSFTKELLACQYRLSEVVEMLTAAEANIRKCAQVVFVKFYDQFLIPSSSFGDSLKLCRRLTHYAFRTVAGMSYLFTLLVGFGVYKVDAKCIVVPLQMLIGN